MSSESGVSVQWNWFNYFMDISKNAFLHNNSSFMASIGQRRSGKSVFTLGACCRVDPDFPAEQICFSSDDLKEQLNEKTCTSILWEEAGASAFARDFMSESNRAVVKTLQVYGFKKLAIFGNYQHMLYLDSDVRLQLDCIFKMKAQHVFEDGQPVTHTFALPYKVVTDWIKKPTYRPYKVLRDEVWKDIGAIPVPDMEVYFKYCGVSKQLYHEYERKKQEYFEDMNNTETDETRKELFTKRELKKLTTVNQTFLTLVNKLIDEGVSKSRIAGLAEIPVSTLNGWLGRSDDADDWAKRILTDEPTATSK